MRPPRADGAWSGTGPTSGSCEVQIVHAQEVEGSLITVFLPPGWSATAPAGTYPIVFNGFYDLNRNTFEQHGPFLARLVGQSSLGGRRGVVGVLWNGGGAEVSRTFDERAYVQFARIVDEIAARYGGHRRWIVTFGGSRGAVTALGMASNPRGHDQRVVLAAGVAPATLVGDHAELMGPTYPGLMHAVGWSTGLADAWRTGWRYPSCGRAELVGLTGMQAALQIMIGTSDRATANARSLLSGAWLDGLVAAGTQVHLEVTAHDFICPFALQLRYARALQARGVPVDLRVGVRAGHHDIAEPGHAQTIRDEVVESAIAVLTDPSLDLDGAVPSLVAPGTRYYRVDRATSADEEIPTPAATPFTVDLPYVVARGQRVPAVAVGAPGTEWRLGYAVPGLPDQIVLGEIGADETSVVFVDVPMDYPVGTFGCALEIRRPGATTYETIPPTSTPTGDTCTLTVVPEEPALDYGEVMTAARPPALPGRETSTWGLSEL